MAQKGIWRAGTDTPDGLAGHPVSPQAYQRTVASLKNAYANKVPLTFSTDADYWVAGKTRGEVCIEFLKTWKDAGIPNADILRAMTINGYKVSETEKTRGPIKAGLLRRPHRPAGQSAGRCRRAEERAVRHEGRDGVQEGRRDDAGRLLPRRSGQRLADPLTRSCPNRNRSCSCSARRSSSVPRGSSTTSRCRSTSANTPPSSGPTARASRRSCGC